MRHTQRVPLVPSHADVPDFQSVAQHLAAGRYLWHMRCKDEGWQLLPGSTALHATGQHDSSLLVRFRLLNESLPCLTAFTANLQAPCKMGSAFLPRHNHALRMCGTSMVNAAPLVSWRSTTKTLAVLPAWISFLLSIAHTSAVPVVRRTSALLPVLATMTAV